MYRKSSVYNNRSSEALEHTNAVTAFAVTFLLAKTIAGVAGERTKEVTNKATGFK
jgi:hypothetical protein